GGPALLDSIPIVATTGTSTTSSRLFAVIDGGGFCNFRPSSTVVDFGANTPAVGADGNIYSGASQAIVVAKFDGLGWTPPRASSESSRYRGQPAFRGQTVLLSTGPAGTVDAFAFIDPLNSPAPAPFTMQAVTAGVTVTQPT